MLDRGNHTGQIQRNPTVFANPVDVQRYLIIHISKRQIYFVQAKTNGLRLGYHERMNMFFMNNTENRKIQYTLYKNPEVLRKAIRDGWKKKITLREHAVMV